MAGRSRPVAGADRPLTPDRLAALLAAALPAEELSADELGATLFEDPDGEVLGNGGGNGAVGVAVRDGMGYITVVVVDPASQRSGIGTALLGEAHSWLRHHGIARVVTGAAGPRYLWPGVDVDAHRAAVALFTAAGYALVGEHHNHRCATAFRAVPPPGVTVRRARDDLAESFAAATFPHWVDEVARATATGCCHVAVDDASGAAVGFGCHSVNRAGWIGPMATDPAWQGRGVGSAVLGAVCRDLDLAGLDHAEIAWVGPDAFYAKAAGTVRSRRFAVLARDVPP